MVREAVLALRAGKGMVLDAADHDTWSVGSFFTNPVVTPQISPSCAPGRRPGAELSRAGRGQAGRGLAGRAGRVRQGLPGARRAPPAVDQARAGRDQPRRRRPRTCWRWPERCATACATCSASHSHPSRCWLAAFSRPRAEVAGRFRRYLDVVNTDGHSQPAPGADDPGGRRRSRPRARRVRRPIGQAGREGQAAGAGRADVPAGRQGHQGAADRPGQRRGPRRLVAARRR